MKEDTKNRETQGKNERGQTEDRTDRTQRTQSEREDEPNQTERMQSEGGRGENRSDRNPADRNPSMKDDSKRGGTGNLRSLYEEDLKDIYWAENHLLKTLPKMAEAAESETLRSAFEGRRAESERNVGRLEKVFASSGIKVNAKKCEGMEGITRESDTFIGDHEKGFVRDAGLITAGRKVEHYKMAAYGSLHDLAQVLTLGDAAKILKETLDEGDKADKQLMGLSEKINAQAYARPMQKVGEKEKQSGEQKQSGERSA